MHRARLIGATGLMMALGGSLVACTSSVDREVAESSVVDEMQATSAPAEPRPTPVEAAPAEVVLSPEVQAQIEYVATYWSDYNADEYGVLGEDDCVNFASQSLVARGWVQQEEWTHDADDVFSSGVAWRSSTSFQEWMSRHPELGTELDDSQRAEVRVGDIVQFDWDLSGDRDHTGVVTAVTTTLDGETSIEFAGHTLDSYDRDVDEAITVDHPGAAVYYWRLAS